MNMSVEEKKTNVHSETICRMLLINGLIVAIRLWNTVSALLFDFKLVTKTNFPEKKFNLIFNHFSVKNSLTLYPPGYFYTRFVPVVSKNCLVSDRSKIFCLLKLFFVKFLKIDILRF